MLTRFGRGRTWCLAGMLGLAPLLVPAAAFALYPPVIPAAPVVPAAQPVQPVVVPQVIVVDPPVGVVGEPEPIDPPDTAKTPEPATLATAVIGAAFAGRLLRNRKNRS